MAKTSDASGDATSGDATSGGATQATPPPYYNCHIFCCTNMRDPDDPRGCCGEKGSAALRDYMKVAVRRLRLPKIRVNASGCLDRCELGPVMVIYPEGIWYHYRNEADVDEILKTHLGAGRRVERLLLQPGDVSVSK